MVTVALANNPGGAVLGGTLSATASNGVATFTGLTLNTTGTNFTLQVTSGNLTAATTSGINVTTVTATHLVVTMQPPGSVTAGNAFGLTVTAEDGSGNAAPSFNTPITVALAGSSGTVLLGGTLTATPTNGVATLREPDAERGRQLHARGFRRRLQRHHQRDQRDGPAGHQARRHDATPGEHRRECTVRPDGDGRGRRGQRRHGLQRYRRGGPDATTPEHNWAARLTATPSQRRGHVHGPDA